MIDRRDLLRQSVGAATMAALSPVLARARAIGPDRRTGTLGDVAHIVVLMQENRSFDHYFGTMPGVRGFGDRFTIPMLSDGHGARAVWDQRDATANPPRLIRPFPISTQADYDLMRMQGTPHNWRNAQGAWDHGRMGHWPEFKTQRTMAYYTREDLPFQWAMADAFTLCDAYHCAMQCGTNTNRLFHWTGTNDPHATGGGPAIQNPDDDLAKADSAANPRFYWTTYPERLEAAGISWAIYQDMADFFSDNPLANMLQFRAAYRGDAGSRRVLAEKGLSTRGLDRLRADAIADRLPQISWIVGTAEGSEHPGPSSPAQGAAYTAKVIEALTANPAVWARTVLLINFDENDGFFDHVPPPAPPSPDPDAPGGYAGASTVSTRGEYHLLPAPGADDDDIALRGRPYGLGPRVPMYVLSPWSRGGKVHSEVADHTSVIRLMEARFGVKEPNISPWRRAVCSDLTTAFDFAHAPVAADLLSPALTASMAGAQSLADRAALILQQPDPHPPHDQPLPHQPAGARPACPVRYALDVTGRLDGTAFALTFTAKAGLAAVFHVYNRHALDRVPHRFTVAPGQQITAQWELAGPAQAYDLWVLGPAGFHRAFAGHGGAEPDLAWDITGDALHITAAGGLQIAPQAYAGAHKPWTAPATGGTAQWPLAPTHGWYDLLVTGPDGWHRRLAGRVEGAWPAITDPA